MERRLGVSGKLILIALCIALSLSGCQQATDDDGAKTTVKYYPMTGFTTTAQTGAILDDGVTQTAYTLEKPDASIVAGTSYWGTQTRVGIKDQKLYVMDIDPSLNPDLSVALGLPNGHVRGLQDTAQMAEYIDNYTARKVVGGVNADFFDTISGGPLGFSMTNGRWITTCEYTEEGTWDYYTSPTATPVTYDCHPGYAFGVKSDGTAIIDIPVVTMSFSAKRTTVTGSYPATTTVADIASLPASNTIDILNQLRADCGDAGTTGSQPDSAFSARLDNDLVLYTSDYFSSTMTPAGGVEVIFKTNDWVTSNGTITGTTDSIITTGNAPIAPGTMVLSATGATATALLNLLVPYSSTGSGASKVVQYDTITVTVGVNDAWKDVVECVGGGRPDGDPLLVKDGAMQTWDTGGQDYTTDATTGLVNGWYGDNPRTAIGVRADGSYFFYVADGRYPDVSIGATITELAQFAIDMGATIAMNLDGGGSATMIRKAMTDEEIEAGPYVTVNHPAYGYLRSDGNAFYVVTK